MKKYFKALFNLLFSFFKDKKQQREEAKKYIKENIKDLIKTFVNDNNCQSYDEPISIFMAGSPGAGKTEYSISLLKRLKVKAVRIDADEIKEWIPGYKGKNAEVFHSASALGVEKLYDCALKNKKNIILDGTFDIPFEKAKKNIKRSLDKKRHVEIHYIYQDPVLAWHFTRIREIKEGRHVPKKIFLSAFKNSGKNVLEIKKTFGNKVTVCLIHKNFDRNLEKFYDNIDDKFLENYLNKVYNKKPNI